MDGHATSDGTRSQPLWLCPSASALIALASEPCPLASLLHEPSIILLTLRFARPTPSLESFDIRLAREPLVAEAAAVFLEKTTHHTPRAAIHRLAAMLGEQAERLANDAGFAFPQAARVLGVLVLLPELMGRVGHRETIVRQLAALWRLPHWVTAVIGNLNLEPTDAIALGAHAELFVIVRTAVAIIERDCRQHGTLQGTLEGILAGILGRSTRPQLESVATLPSVELLAHDDPTREKLLPQLLRQAAQLRRRTAPHRTLAAESEVQRLHQALSQLRDDFEHTLRDAKLAGLAELAAGAGHEINNPLAIISGTAQLLRKTELDSDRRRSLDKITHHTKRISDIIRDLMTFSRPSQPNRVRVSVGELVRDVGNHLDAEVAAKTIQLRYDLVPGLWANLDVPQIRRCLENLIRNAVQAAPLGSVITLATTADESTVRVAVCDSGPGPDEAIVPFLFDPFFSGRSAGRGRGLGLSTAWRLAKVNGGDLRFTRTSTETVFELTFPLAPHAIRNTA